MKSILTRPLKAPTKPVLDFAALQNFLPFYASDKEDGIRCMICPDRGPISGQMKPIPNDWIHDLLNMRRAFHLDGELVALDCEGGDADFNDTQSAVMSQAGCPAFQFRVFDWYGNIYAPYKERMKIAEDMVLDIRSKGYDHVTWLWQELCESVNKIEAVEADAIKRGKEGIMLRSPDGWYKEGRSTFNEAYLLKVKRFTDDEARVIGVEEEMENCNPAKRNERGLQERSKHKAGLKGKGMVGRLICRWGKHIIKIGSGMTQLQKRRWWENPTLIVGKTITFKYQLHGMKVLPRAPIFKSIRHPYV